MPAISWTAGQQTAIYYTGNVFPKIKIKPMRVLCYDLLSLLNVSFDQLGIDLQWSECIMVCKAYVIYSCEQKILKIELGH